MSQNNTIETPAQELARLKAEYAKALAENVALKAAQPKPGQLSISIGKSGTVCLSGMGAYPLALYKSQWLKVFEALPRVKAFIEANDANLSQGKDDTRFAKATT